MPQFQGVDIVPMPSAPAPKQIELIKTTLNGQTVGMFAPLQQIFVYPGADLWSANVTFPQMNRTEILPWSAWLGATQGIKNVFLLGDPMRRHPQGGVSGLPVTDGVQAAMSNVLKVKGWTPSTMALLPGDLFSIGYRLHEVLNRVMPDADGQVTYNIWPSLRESVPDGTALTLNNPQGLFRRVDNKLGITTNETRLAALPVLKCVEAR